MPLLLKKKKDCGILKIILKKDSMLIEKENEKQKKNWMLTEPRLS